jgi:uncharacterized SAM-binding protein YcdF (DUF218 family)
MPPGPHRPVPAGEAGGVVLRLLLLLAVAAVAYLGFTFAQVVVAARQDRAQAAEAIVVLGAAQYDGRPSAVLRGRLDHAADLYSRGLAPIVVVTGGRRPGDRYSEAQVAAGYLGQRGIPEPALRREVDGENSWQSLAAVARFLRAEGVREVILVTSPYHALRTSHIAGEVGLIGRPSPAAGSAEGLGRQLRHYLRETAAVAVGRITGYGRLVDLDERVGRVRRNGGSG